MSVAVYNIGFDLQSKKQITCGCTNATIMYVKPEPDSASKERLANLLSSHKLPEDTEIDSAFYFDLTVRSLLALK